MSGRKATGERGRANLALAGLAVTLLVAACSGPSSMRIANRTQVPVVVGTGRSRLVVEACAERTVALAGGVWGGDDRSVRHDEEAPPGAYVLELHDWAVALPIEGRNDRTVVVTRDYIGYAVGSSDPIAIAGPGSFPADPAAVECAGPPPPQPSLSLAPSSAAR